MPLDTRFGSLDHNGLIQPEPGNQDDEEDLEQNAEGSLKDQQSEESQESNPDEGAADAGSQPKGEAEQERDGPDGLPDQMQQQVAGDDTADRHPLAAACHHAVRDEEMDGLAEAGV